MKSILFKFQRTTLLAFLFSTHITFTQQEKIAFEKYGISEGLPEERVTSLVFDDQGFIWIATESGLVKFDGYDMQIRNGTIYKDGSKELAFNNISRMIKANNGNLWLSESLGNGGMASFDTRTETFKNYFFNSKDSTHIAFKSSNYILFEDSKSHIWFYNFSTFKDTSVVGRLNPKTNDISIFPFKNICKKSEIFRRGGWATDFLVNERMLEFSDNNSIWLLDQDGNLNVYNRKNDAFEVVIDKGAEIPETGIKDSLISIKHTNTSHIILNGKQGFYLWDPVSKKCIKAYTDFKNNNAKFEKAIQDNQGEFWVTFSNGNISRIDPKTDTTLNFENGKEHLSFNNGLVTPWSYWYLSEDRNGIWFQIFDTEENHGFLYYNYESKSFTFYNEQFNDAKNQFTDNDTYYNMKQDSTGLRYLFSRTNLYKESPKTRQIKLNSHDAFDSASIASNKITALFEDSKDRLWIGTSEGLSIKVSNDKFERLYMRDDRGRKRDLGDVERIYEDSKGNIWVTIKHLSLLKYNEVSREFETVDFHQVSSILEDKNGHLWLNSWFDGVFVIDVNSNKIIKQFKKSDKEKHGLLSSEIVVMFLDSKGYMWLGDYGKNEYGLFRYDESTNTFMHYTTNENDSNSINSNAIHTIIEDDLKRVWVATDKGVNLYDHAQDVFYPVNNKFNMASTRNIINSEDGKIWAATYASSGLALIGPGTSDIEVFGEDLGMLHNDADNLVLDDEGHIWIPNKRGLSIFNISDKSFRNYYEKDGFQDYQVPLALAKTALKTHDGDIWIGGNNGLNHIIPDMLFKKDSSQPSVYITKISIMDSIYSEPDGSLFKQSVSYSDKVILDYWQKDLSFDFVGIHFLRSQDNLYSWKLENYDNKWSQPSKDKRATYTNLSPGKYKFQVKAANADGIWNHAGATMQIIIKPPFWQTWWSYFIYSILLLLAGFKIYDSQKKRAFRIAKQKTQQKELEQAKEIEKAFTKLKSTQAQLLHSEKMASLGELTAGIAHEIQNPLNFVNNFSEVSQELLEEMLDELENGDTEEVKAIINDITQNLEKINHHGKRADGIVKGMLQHSRAGGDKKELTEINILADEYLRLAYHGLRAKDKSFNANLETNFDENIKKIDIIPQDIGRVILNLLTNAFYAVHEKKKTAVKDYQPTVSVTTKNLKSVVKVIVTDNGTGMPEAVKEKIFQPFFTTKPTGQGTGLGLSLSYDIVTKGHGGRFQVDSKEGHGTTFTISLPKK